MEKELATGAEVVFPHIRNVMGMIVGLGMARPLSGVARIVQHPKGYRLYSVHLARVASALLMLMHFWWWEFGLFAISQWTFGTYLFIISYAVLLFLRSALLFPDSMPDYDSYEDFFILRRALVLWRARRDLSVRRRRYADQGAPRIFERFGTEHMIRTTLLVALCVAAALTADRRFHGAFVPFTLIYQISWILRLFDTIA